MTTPAPLNDLGRVHNLIPEAIGRPGQRRFRLIIEGVEQVAISWMGKEQLQELSLSILRQLGPISGSRKNLEQFDVDKVTIDLEFRAAVTSLTLDEEAGLFFIEIHERDALSTQPLIGFSGSLSVAHEMAFEALDICAAGRPLCPLCHSPLDDEMTHVCPLSNGHHVV
jgi:hypothetical protein